jgi:hypothetical protein
MQRRRLVSPNGGEKAAGATGERLPPGAAKDQLLQKIEQIETVSRTDKWLSSPGLQSQR